jgi:site-specific DNA recombinase
MKAAIYTRISEDPNGEKLGVQRQLDDCLELAAQLGWEVVARYDDNDISAYSGKRRPGFEAMLVAMENREFGALLVWHTDRLYRSMKDLERLIGIADVAGVQIRTVNGGDLDLSNATGKMVARILGSVSRQESEHKSERQKRANVQKAAAGKWQTGNRCFGYDMAGNPVPEEADAIRAAVSDVLGGKSLTQISREWNLQGLKGSRGTAWKSPRLRRVLVNPRYAGLKTHQGREVATGDWTPLIDVDTHRGLVAYLSTRDRNNIGSKLSFEKKHMGSMVYRCGGCGGVMKHSSPGPKQPRRYECTNRGKDTRCVVRVGQPLDDWVTVVLIKWVKKNRSKLTVDRQGKTVDVADLHAQRQGHESRLDELLDMFTAGRIDGKRLDRGTANLKAKIRDIDNVLASLKMRSPLADLATAGETPEEIQRYWDDLSPDVRGKIISEAFDVRVLPAPRGTRFSSQYVDMKPKREF